MLNEADDENIDNPNLTIEWRSNSDLIAQLLLNEQEIINLIVRVLVGTHIPKNSYVMDQNGWPVAESLFKVYKYQNESDERFKPIVVTIQSEINQVSILKVIRYCGLVHERFNSLPIVLIIANKDCLSSNEDEPNLHLVKVKSEFWAEKCLMFLSELDVTTLNDPTLNAFHALCHFLSHPDKIFSFSSDEENQTINLLIKAII